ncbi:DUF2332 domain-containing protein [Sphingomicrobium astaxanthinifaciens]|uniref:DUF2332 domain-containing protein n=1 Tax=Sphingomicrobium astaxanthinifaciens TaxID=1227949 RepID=UPI001FCB548F|nr:DUF2332 domain-containing protein [Sphingomicrobium astaxanthinifaciens]MCJ7421380.1 DUF2332 domain-containing protein [Sphingomicrobium astaxanthinifaciens]
MTATPAQAFSNQADYCRANGAPLTAAICRAVWKGLDPDSALGRMIHRWPRDPLKDVVPLRVAAGLQALHLSGAEPRLAPLYAGELLREEIAPLVAAVLRAHEAAILPWMERPPQTNEAGRSAGLMAGLKWLAGQGLGPRFELVEIGSSAGINLMIDRFFIDLAGTRNGPADSPVRLAPKWKGAPPPEAPVAILAATGCDRDPLDLARAADRIRLAAYVWPEMKERTARLEAVFDLAAARGAPQVVEADAADFVEAQLAAPRENGVTRVLMHSLVWQYLPAETQARIRLAMTAAGEAASAHQPLAWVSLEGDRALLRHVLKVRYWPGGAEEATLAHGHAHGGWIDWLAEEVG